MESKTILIIGGTSGIGESIAENLNNKGHKVIVTGRTVKSGVDNCYPLDFTQEQISFPDIGEIDGIAYCPGTINLKPFLNLNDSNFRDDLEINFLGAVKTIRHYASSLKNDASIIFFSSVAAQFGMPYHTSIAASKGAIEGFTKALASEFAPRIRVNAIAPSLTETRLSKHLINNEIKRKSAIGRHPLKKIGTTDDIANLATFLLLPDSKFITGQVININGGLSSIS